MVGMLEDKMLRGSVGARWIFKTPQLPDVTVNLNLRHVS